MNKFDILNGTKIKPEMLKEIINLDKKVYEEKYWTNIGFMTKWFSKNPYIITMIYDKGNLAGYFCYLPIEDESYLEIRKGEVFQDLTIPVENIKKYKKGESNNLYLFSIVLDPKYQGTDALRYLLKGFYDNTKELKEKGVIFNKLLGDVVSDKGYKLAKSLGFNKVYDTEYNSVMFESYYDNMIEKYEKKYKE
ncbi:hypothetical protein RBU49_15510 [Clostridium sp. MB40-C1]|uniref:hypothetical protein n=1 Tax=Clostridium sp. MB40-C1 TaxID=3070996 RepID=UPI0027E02F67|nr:hypothetical protein [Clostridium sp. MB40-C1]WMJ80210.1 hypothetical protein RBU49_15510 [Clostridium sp. MB40-C1]